MKTILHFFIILAIMAMPCMAGAQCTDYETIPYTTGFEGLSTGQLPSCWQQLQSGSSSASTFPSAYAYASNARNGSVYFEFESSTGQTELVALPLMQNISSLKLTFWASLMNHNFVLEVGVMEDSVFVPVDTIDNLIVGSGGNWHNSYHEYTVYFAEYYGSGERIAMRVTASGSYTLMLDDFTVSEFNGCYPLSNLHLVDADSAEITVAWSDEMNVGANYTVAYWKDGGDTTVDYSTDTFYTASNLDASSNYHFMVTPNCSTGDGTSATGSFRTTCGLLMIPFTESFESASSLECWSRVSCHNSTGYYSGNAHSGSGSFRFYFNTNPPQYLVTPPLGGTDNNGILVSFWYKKYSASYTENFKVGYSTTTADISAFTWGSEVIPTQTYQEFTAVYPAGVKYIAIQYMQNNGYYLYIDDFHVTIDNGCNKPNDAIVDSVGPYTAHLHWTNGGAASTAYNLYYGTQNNITVATAITGITDTAYTLTGLLPQTTYYAWVRTECSGDSPMPNLSTVLPLK